MKADPAKLVLEEANPRGGEGTQESTSTQVEITIFLNISSKGGFNNYQLHLSHPLSFLSSSPVNSISKFPILKSCCQCSLEILRNMSSLDSRNFEEGQVSQPVCLAANVTSGTDLSHGNSLSRNEMKVSDVLPSLDPALPGALSNRLPISKSQNRIDGGVIQSEGSCRRFTLDEVLLATDNFDDAFVIGIGGFGKVYKGFIGNGATTVVAIKRLNAESNQGAEEFWTEVNLLSKFHHTNLVALIGYCNENREMILVYEYLARGTLANHLYKSSREESSESISQYLTWAQRLNICLGAARGLDYLHTGTEQRIIHRDVKTTNILLDKKWVAKVSDFGICKLITSQATTHVSTKVKATRGYWDPEYFITGQVTRKSDVYAFGVVLLEVLCGRPPLDDSLEEEQVSLINWAKMYIQKGKLDRIMDPSINGETTPHSLKYFAKLANNCLHIEPKKRPTMSEVVKSLEIAMVSHERKGRSQGTIAKAFQGINLVPKVMNRWLSGGPILDDLTQSVYPRFLLPEIHAATNDFNDGLLISRDSWFRLYKGCMVGGTRAVMIKRYDAREAHSARLVSAEIGVQALPRHPNIVSLIGFCEEKHELILLYDYMVNGTLKSRLHETQNDPFHWKKRLKICIDIARGLEYLHTNVEQQFVHRHITPSNIFLDDEWVVKIAAFEMSVPIHNSKATEGVETAVCGTYAYLDPEYLRTSKVTKKTDVFAFGVVLLEVLCAKTPFSSNQNRNEVWWNEIWLVDWFRVCIGIGTIDEVIDPYLIGKIAPECFRHYVNLALSCLPYEGIRRPSMTAVLGSLQCSLKMQEAWENSIMMGDELHMADVPGSYNDVISGESEFIIGEQSYLISDLVPPWSAISTSGY